jgi:hypothetical protein
MGLHDLFNFITNIGKRRIITMIKRWLQRFSLKKIRRLYNGYIDWGLGVERPFLFSSKFPIKHSSVTITGSQVTHNASWPVKYSIVKINKLGTSIQYFDSVIYYGDYSEGELNHTFHIPNGTGYQLEVFNYFKYHSTGRIQIIHPLKESSS